MYVSMVILPNGQVLETGGGLLDRQAPYIKEASMYNPSTNKFTGMAADPQPRGYHSTALLLPDGRVMTYGNNPGDGSFNEKISIYSPPYLFHGARPQIKSVASPTAWHYGKAYNITDEPEDRLRRAHPAGRGHPPVRPEPAVRRAADVGPRQHHRAERDQQPEHGAARLVHAVRQQRERRPVGRQVDPPQLRKGDESR